jgi:hypothetical protein
LRWVSQPCSRLLADEAERDGERDRCVVVFSFRRSIRPDAFAADKTRTAGLRLRGRLVRGTSVAFPLGKGEDDMNNIIYLIGLVVVVVAILAFFGLR